MNRTRLPAPYQTINPDGTASNHSHSSHRFYGVAEKPFLEGKLFSPSALEDHRSNYGASQHNEATWRGQDPTALLAKPAPATPNGIAVTITGKLRQTFGDAIHVIADDGSNHLYSGVIELQIHEGDPELSRAYWLGEFGVTEDGKGEKLLFDVKTNRAQLEFLFRQIGRGGVGIGVILDIMGFYGGFVETTATIQEFRLTTYPLELYAKSEVRPMEAVPPPPPPVDHRPALKKISDNVGWLIMIGVCILAAVMFNHH